MKRGKVGHQSLTQENVQAVEKWIRDKRRITYIELEPELGIRSACNANDYSRSPFSPKCFSSTMSTEGVMVSYNHSEGEHANIVTVAASGIKFGDRWVLTHGSILSPLKQAKDINRAKGKPILSEQFYENLPEIYVTCERPKSDELQKYYDGLEALSRQRSLEGPTDPEHSSYQVRVLTGRICHVWQCPLLDRNCIKIYKNSIFRPQPMLEPARNMDQDYRWKEGIMGYASVPRCPGAELVGRFQKRHKVATERSVDDVDLANNSTAAVHVAI
ncbi:hypothetical protein EVAR_61355_1 [Eumeta japonica]|uniref:Uncharacterized protein n=1 Tax=Eumeta variegata TaxID=151549 RepID=A0A4C1ZUJ6_EUMVA|nr:hypothetical protein EVAR_61355_1 [Eumeta japonica]